MGKVQCVAEGDGPGAGQQAVVLRHPLLAGRHRRRLRARLSGFPVRRQDRLALERYANLAKLAEKLAQRQSFIDTAPRAGLTGQAAFRPIMPARPTASCGRLPDAALPHVRRRRAGLRRARSRRAIGRGRCAPADRGRCRTDSAAGRASPAEKEPSHTGARSKAPSPPRRASFRRSRCRCCAPDRSRRGSRRRRRAAHRSAARRRPIA